VDPDPNPYLISVPDQDSIPDLIQVLFPTTYKAVKMYRYRYIFYSFFATFR
jgi:hypothetical protein